MVRQSYCAISVCVLVGKTICLIRFIEFAEYRDAHEKQLEKSLKRKYTCSPGHVRLYCQASAFLAWFPIGVLENLCNLMRKMQL